MRKPNLMNSILALILLASFANAAETKKPPITLKMGNRAPALQVDEWVKGGPISKLEEGNIYILEFWATWCGPCKSAIPHVTELQKKYQDKGVTVIGMNIWEPDLEEVAPFVQEMGDKMGYAVATDILPVDVPENEVNEEDESKGAMADSWMKAAGRNGIPCSFIVNREGIVAWIGHPMLMDEALEAILNGTYDVAKEAAKAEKISQLEDQYAEYIKAKDFDQAIATIHEREELSGKPNSMQTNVLRVLLMKKDYDKANELVTELEQESANDPKELTQLGATLAINGIRSPIADRGLEIVKQAAAQDGDHKDAVLSTLFRIYLLNRNYDQALATLDELAAVSKEPAELKPERVSVLFQKKDLDAANKLLAELEQEATGDTQKTLAISRLLLRNSKAQAGNLDRALSTAEKAVAIGGKRKPAAQRFLASIYAIKKDYGKAIEVQKQAVEEVAAKPGLRKREERILKQYEKAALKASAAEKSSGDDKPSSESSAEPKE